MYAARRRRVRSRDCVGPPPRLRGSSPSDAFQARTTVALGRISPGKAASRGHFPVAIRSGILAFAQRNWRRLPLALGPAARPPKMSSDVQARIRPADHPVRRVSALKRGPDIHLSDSSNCQFPVITVTWRTKE